MSWAHFLNRRSKRMTAASSIWRRIKAQDRLFRIALHQAVFLLLLSRYAFGKESTHVLQLYSGSTKKLEHFYSRKRRNPVEVESKLVQFPDRETLFKCQWLLHWLTVHSVDFCHGARAQMSFDIWIATGNIVSATFKVGTDVSRYRNCCENVCQSNWKIH